MASNQLNILFDEESKTVMINSDFSKESDFDKLKQKIYDRVRKRVKPGSENPLKETDFFVLECEKSIREKYKDIPQIFDSETYQYFISKLQTIPELSSTTIRLFIKKVDKLPEKKLPFSQEKNTSTLITKEETKELPSSAKNNNRLDHPVKPINKNNNFNLSEILEWTLKNTYNEICSNLKNELNESKLIVGKKEFDRKKFSTNEYFKDSFYKGININTICENCLETNFYGIRYICAECNNFNLCYDCKNYISKNYLHNYNHNFIQIKRPIIEDINNFNNIISPNKMFFDDQETSFSVKITLVNNGENNLSGCFITPVRYGKKYLSCLKRTITESLEKNEKTEIELFIKFPEYYENNIINDNNNFNQNEVINFEGYFRMFTEEGLPFGNIIYIKVKINKNNNMNNEE